jgi:hypothetical protein
MPDSRTARVADQPPVVRHVADDAERCDERGDGAHDGETAKCADEGRAVVATNGHRG